MAADPAVVTDGDGLGELDVVAARADVGLVGGGEDAHVGAEHDAVADRHQRAVEDRQVEVGVDALPELDVAPVVDVQRRLEVDVVAHLAHHFAELAQSLGLERVEVGVRVRVWPPAVVFVAPCSSLEADSLQRWDGRVVSRIYFSSV